MQPRRRLNLELHFHALWSVYYAFGPCPTSSVASQEGAGKERYRRGLQQDAKEFVIHSTIRISSRSWIIEHVPRDDQDDVTMRQWVEYQGKLTDRRLENIYKCKIRSMFREIWPPKEGRKDWRDD